MKNLFKEQNKYIIFKILQKNKKENLQNHNHSVKDKFQNQCNNRILKNNIQN